MRNNKSVLDTLKVRHAMVDRGFTQTKLAESVGVHQSRVSSWLRGQDNPDLQSAMSLVRVLGVTVDFLLLPN